MDSDCIIQVQESLGFTNYEFSVVLGVSEKTVEAWRGGWRSPQGSSAELIRLVGQIAEVGRVTREDLLSRVGYSFVEESH